MSDKCTICGSNKNVIEHHISYSRDDTIPMCRSCHGKVHHNPEHRFYPVDLPPWRGSKVSVAFREIDFDVNGEDKGEKSEILKYLERERYPDSFSKYKIVWLNNLISLPETSNLNVAFCEKNKNPSFIGLSNRNKDKIRSIIIRDVFTDSEGCEDSRYCLDLDCEHNNIDFDYFRKFFSSNPRKDVIREFSKLIRDVANKSIKKPEKLFEINGSLYYEKPPIEVEYCD